MTNFQWRAKDRRACKNWGDIIARGSLPLGFGLKHMLNGQALSACCDLLRESLAKRKAAHWDTLCNDFLACAGHVLRMLMTPLQTYNRQRCQGTLQNVEIGLPSPRCAAASSGPTAHPCGTVQQLFRVFCLHKPFAEAIV